LMMQPDIDWSDWLRLEQTAGVGLETARKLLMAFGLPANIFQAEFTSLRAYVSQRVAVALSEPISTEIEARIVRTRLWCEQSDNYVVTLVDPAYPAALLEIPDPPLLLYVKGRLELLSSPSIAVVGSRNATAQGLSHAEKFSEILSLAGLTISSGMAAGIDAAAHQGGLRGVGSTVAVIGTGADLVYPSRNRNLAHLIASDGCIVSEYALGTPALASNFPRRNRIISGLAKGVLVIEAAAQSGSLITARMAAEQGRDVFAIPGSIHSPLSKGCHQLIKQGAKLVDSAQDILDELHFVSPHRLISDPSLHNTFPVVSDDLWLTAMGYDPVHIEVLSVRSGLDIAAMSAKLLEYELNGSIESLQGGMYRRLAQ
jgi:DNA processing protein